MCFKELPELALTTKSGKLYHVFVLIINNVSSVCNCNYSSTHSGICRVGTALHYHYVRESTLVNETTQCWSKGRGCLFISFVILSACFAGGRLVLWQMCFIRCIKNS